MNFNVTAVALEQIKQLELPKEKGIRVKADLVPG